MPPNLSMSTGFGLFQNSNFLTAHGRVVDSYIGAFYVYSFVVPLLKAVTRNLSLVMRNTKPGER